MFARRFLAINAIGAILFSVLHVILAAILERPVNVYLAVTVALFAIATVGYFAASRRSVGALVIYCAAYWLAITFMAIHYARTGEGDGLPSVLWWLMAGAFALGAVDTGWAIVYLLACALTLLSSAFLYSDLVDALTIYPFLTLAAGVGFWLRNARGQLKKIDRALRICKDAPEREPRHGR